MAKELVRSTDDRMLAGVCAGVARYFNVDPGLVRILTVVLTLVTFVPVIVYVAAIFVLPERSTEL